MNQPVSVSVCVFSYNFEKYIVQAVESVLTQQTSFTVEILVADDCSTDNTRKLLQQLQEMHPSIRLLLNERNVGGTRNWVNAFRNCSGKYIALLDGDDYFCDPLKLQKQFDALEGDPSATMCLHDVLEHYEDNPAMDRVVSFGKDRYNIKDILEQGWFIRTSSTFMRNIPEISHPPDWVYDYPYRYDTILQVFQTQKGEVINIKHCMSVYRKYAAGYSNNFKKDVIKNTLTAIDLHRILDKHTGYHYSRVAGLYISREYTYLLVELVKKFRARNIGLFFRALFNIHFPTLRKMLSNKLRRRRAEAIL